MKQFWRNIIFADHPAQGAFFVLWLLMLGSYILFSLLLLTLAGDWCQVSPMRQQACVIGWAAAQLGLIGYYSVVSWRFFGASQNRIFSPEVLIAAGSIFVTVTGLVWLRGYGWPSGWLLLIVWLLFAPAAAIVGGAMDCRGLLRQHWGHSQQFRLLVIAGAGITLLLLLMRLAGWVSWSLVLSVTWLWCLIAQASLPRVRSWRLVWIGVTALGLLVAGIAGLAYMVNFFDYYNAAASVFVGEKSSVIACYQMHRWIFPAAILAALVGGAFFYGILLAVIAGVPQRSLWGKSLFWLLAAAVAAYLLFGLAALVSQRQLEQTREALGQRLGCAISHRGLSQYYGHSDLAAAQTRSDNLAAAWREVSTLAGKWLDPLGSDAHDSAQVKEVVRDFLAKCPQQIEAWQKLMPLPGMRYPQNIDFSKTRPAFYKTPDLLQWPMTDLYLYRLAQAVDRRDAAAAKTELQYLQNWADYLKEYFPIDYYRRRLPNSYGYWCNFTLLVSEDDDYLKGIDLLSGANLLSAEDWAAVTAHLRQREEEILQRKQALIYMLCVCDLASRDDVVAGDKFVQFRPTPRQLRRFLPAMEYYCNRDLIRAWEISGDETWRQHQAAGNPVHNILRLRLDQLDTLEYIIGRQVAQLRVAQGVAQVAAFRQRHGVYPESLPDLPPDPYSGKPLLYDAHVTQEVKDWYCKPNSFRFWDTSAKDVPAIRVWSVGPNQKDDRGLDDWQQKADDIGTAIRLDKEVKP